MKITGFPLSIVFLSSSFPFHKRENEAQRNKAWKQWEEDEKWKKNEKMNTMRNNEKLWKIEKTNENNEKMMKNKEKNNENWWKIAKNEHNEKMMKNGEKAIRTFSSVWTLIRANGRRKCMCHLYVPNVEVSHQSIFYDLKSMCHL